MSELMPDVEVICVDSNTDRQKQAKDAGFVVYGNLEETVNENLDVAFVCTSPGRHANIILRLIEMGIHVFTELNLTADRYDDIIRESTKRNVKVFMSSTFLYNKQILEIKRSVESTDKPLTYIYHVGQYLPDWHPWENYKDFFIGKKETNGIREIFAVQLPWIIEVFGKITSISVESHKCTDLEIDYKDSVVCRFRHENGTVGVFIADVVARKATTYLEVIGEDIHIFWGGHNDDLLFYNIDGRCLVKVNGYETTEHVDGYADHITENQYKDEIKAFLEMINQNKVPRYSLDADKYVLSIIDEIERKGI